MSDNKSVLPDCCFEAWSPNLQILDNVHWVVIASLPSRNTPALWVGYCVVAYTPFGPQRFSSALLNTRCA